MTTTRHPSLVATAMLFALTVPFAGAAEVKGRWRVDIQVGNTSPQGRIDSPSGSTQTLSTGGPVPVFVRDPRPASTFGDYASTRGQGRIEVHASYGLFARKNSEIVIDVGVGYYRAKVRNLELAYSFDSVDSDYSGAGCETRLARAGGEISAGELDGCTWFDPRSLSVYAGSINSRTRAEAPDSTGQTAFTLFQTEKFEGGEYRAVPISLDLLYRYRPARRFNPYIGGGIGYLVVDMDESERFSKMANDLAGSLVAQIGGPVLNDLSARTLQQVALSNVTDDNGNVVTVRATQLGHRLQRPRIDAPDTFFVEARGGFELQMASKWAFFAEGRYFRASKDITITVDGVEQFGIKTPGITVPYQTDDGQLNPDAYPQGGLGMYIIDGGLRQAAYSLTGELRDPGTNGQPGEYYFNGGRLKYGGWVFTMGMRFTL